MLVEFRVRDLVLIEDLSLALAPGLNVLTGETGAGKSLVAQAVGLLLGRKAEPDIVRRGAEAAEVEGLFDVSDEPAVKESLAHAGLPAGDELLVRRIVPAEGRQRCFLNGRLASLPLLSEIAHHLASFAGQHEHLSLLEPARQRDLLDARGALEGRRAEMSRLAAAATAAAARLEGLRAKDRDRAARLDYLSYQLKEIEDLSPAPDELESLAREAERLRHLAFLVETARRAVDGLYEGEGAAYERLSGLARDLERAAQHDPSLAAPARAIADAAAAVEETARSLAGYGAEEEDAPGRLETVEARRAALEALTRKHGLPLPEVLRRKDEIAAEVADLGRYEEALAEAESALAAAREAARSCAEALSESRRRAASSLSAAVTAECRDLAMAGASFKVQVAREEGEPGPAGFDAVEFLVALNPGEGAHPLRRVASGGELSRLMLAVRQALSGVGPKGTYVFDEVDAGVGGAQAALVGRKLRDVGRHHQVICITHLPQIAGLADTHFAVRKKVEGGRTQTSVLSLRADERVEEIARMIGGETVSDRTRAAARDLMRRRG